MHSVGLILGFAGFGFLLMCIPRFRISLFPPGAANGEAARCPLRLRPFYHQIPAALALELFPERVARRTAREAVHVDDMPRSVTGRGGANSRGTSTDVTLYDRQI